MTETDAVRLTRAHIESKFPKTCSACGRVFATLADYLRQTRHVGQPVAYDAEVHDWDHREPLGTMSLANCVCGTTMAIDSEGMPLRTFARLMMWARRVSRQRHVSMRELLASIRRRIDEQVLSERDGGEDRGRRDEQIRFHRRARQAGGRT